MRKKGAIELSMTTIIVVVIGVTLLILGLTFVRGIFTKLSGISDTTFDEAEDLLKGLEQVDEFLTINPQDVEIKQGTDKPVKVIIANFEEELIKVKAVASSTGDQDLSCLFFDENVKGKAESQEYTLQSGGQKKLVLIAKDNNGPLRRTGCNIVIQGAPLGEDNADTLLIQVV